MDKIGHVVFDIGGVLLHWDPDIPYRSLIPDKAEREWFLTEVCSPAWNHEQDRGRSWEEAEDELIAQHPDLEPLIRAYRANWGEMIPFAYEETVALMVRLVALGRDVTLLTNFASDTFEVARQRYPVLGSVRGVTVSGLVGLVKPDAEIYARHADHFDLNSSAILFIDDKQANVEGAQDAGWQAVRHSNVNALDEVLKERGLL